MSADIQPKVEEGYEQGLQPISLLPIQEIGNVTQLLSAKVEARKEFKPLKRSQKAVVKNDRGEFLYDYDYATLNDINDAVDEALGNHGLDVTFRPYFQDGQYFMRAYLTHISGQFIDCEYLLDPDTSGRKGQHQERGSAMTYGMKYTKSALLGLAPEDDDARRADADLRKRQGQQADQKGKSTGSKGQQPKGEKQIGKPIDYRRLAQSMSEILLIKPSLFNEMTYERYGAGEGIELKDWSSKRMKNAWWENLAIWLKEVADPKSPEAWLARIELYSTKIQQKLREMLELSDLAEMVENWDITWDMADLIAKAKEGTLPTDLQMDVIEACVQTTKWESTASEEYAKWLVKHIGVGVIQNYAQAEQVLGSLLVTVKEQGKKVKMPDLELYSDKGDRRAEGEEQPLEGDKSEEGVPF